MTFFKDGIDIHHVFPRAWCRTNDIPDNDVNTIINKAPLSWNAKLSVVGLRLYI